MQEELHPIPRLQPEMLADGLRNRRLALDRDGRFHDGLHYIAKNVIPHRADAAKRLQAAGFTQAQAEIVDERLATKQDLREQEQRLLSRMEQIEYRIEQLGYKLTLRLGAMLVAAVGVVATLVKLL
jgi:hypothetical protein